MADKKVVSVVEVVAKKLPKNMPIKVTPVDAVSAISDLLSAYKENEITKREIAAINAKKEIMITDIKERYKFYRFVFENVFDERRQHMDKCFEIIDKGISDNNENLVSMGLENLSKVVSSSPIAEAMALKNYIERGNKIEL